jgi:hypothetical protein
MRMTKLGVAALLVGLVACGSKAENREICNKAADRYIQCVGEVLGEDARQLVSSPAKDGREQCAGDQRTVDAYKKCLPQTSCTAFMDCVMGIAMGEP